MSALAERTYELALRALAQQEHALTELRSRTGTLLTAATLIATFLGAAAIDRAGLDLPIVFALFSFGGSVVLCIWVLLPKEGLIFALDGPVAFENLYDLADDDEELHRRLTYWLQAFRAQNHTTVARLTRAFRWAGFALLVEITLLALGLALG